MHPSEIVGDGEDGDGFAEVVAQVGHGKADIDGTAILMPSHRGRAKSRSAVSNLTQDAPMLVGAIVGDQDAEGLSESFLASITETVFGADVPVGDDAVERRKDDGIFRAGVGLGLAPSGATAQAIPPCREGRNEVDIAASFASRAD